MRIGARVHDAQQALERPSSTVGPGRTLYRLPGLMVCSMDGLPLPPAQHAQPGGCRPPAAQRGRDPDDEYRGPRPRDDVPRTSTVRQRFPACASERTIHICTRSPLSYRRELVGDVELMDRGRTFSRSLPRSERGRDFLPHASEDWERRRSRSPDRPGEDL